MRINLDRGYDIETYPNFFCVGFVTDTEYHYFEISTRRNDVLALCGFIDQCRLREERHVGFNNLGFDYPVIHDILEADPYSVTLDLIYGKAMSIINSQDRFGTMVWESDHHVKQIDLYKLNHYDNANKRTSLKQLEFAMRMDNIRDLPFPPGTVLTPEQMDIVASYMRHDIAATWNFYKHNIKAIQLREALSETYGKNMLNFSDSKIGSHILVTKLNEAGIETHEYVGGRKQPRGTPRDSINLGSVVFPSIRFERPEFQALLNWLHKSTVTETKGALSGIPYDADLFQYMDPHSILIPNLTIDDTQGKFKPVKNRKTRLSKLIENGVHLDLSKYPGVCTSAVSGQKGNLHVVVDGFRYDLGTGGIHGSIESQVVRSDDEYVILDYDFASYYPHLSFVNDVYPEHLGQAFCTIYHGMYLDRKAIPKKDPNNYALKIALNGSYGNSNSEYSPFYDPRFTMTITINGQLYLCMMAEQLIKTPGLSVIQVNTDGITVKCPRRYHEHVRSVVKWIEAVSRIEMEEAIYSMMAIRDVNNYIAVYENGDVKRKGAYQKHEDRDWHKDHSAMVIPAAAEAALVYGTDIREFVTSHLDIYDFMLMAKVNRSDKLMLGNEEIQRISRVYASKSGLRLSKVMPPLAGKTDPRPQDMFKTGLFREANDINDASFDDIDYEYYIAEAEKLVKPLLK